MTVGIIGATGYVGAELLRLLLRHPNAEKIVLSSVTFHGQNMEDVYPNFRGLLAPKCDGVLLSADEVLNESQIIFTALPHGIAESYAVFAERNGKKLIDLSADFRFDDDEKTFVQWYKKNWEHPEIHKKSVYGLPEMNRDLIKNACIVGNPGCYVTAITLALLPALKNQIIL
ncbi:MAG: N-acetyl-gamma-glutamyl-phosphate reductase, partial [Spirochaetales bacterium]